MTVLISCLGACVVQTEYVRDLLKESDYPPVDLDSCATMFKEWKADKKASITGYRDKVRCREGGVR